ncbi:hypothetical protein RPMD05_86 [Rhodobacteraceae phage LS06-2018-MD05]|nr:hypothetical protein RPMD05_86 [Rhodobacteraceae phage LS06-2018-MD05]
MANKRDYNLDPATSFDNTFSIKTDKSGLIEAQKVTPEEIVEVGINGITNNEIDSSDFSNITLGTLTVNYFYYRRIGNLVFINGDISFKPNTAGYSFTISIADTPFSFLDDNNALNSYFNYEFPSTLLSPTAQIFISDSLISIESTTITEFSASDTCNVRFGGVIFE